MGFVKSCQIVPFAFFLYPDLSRQDVFNLPHLPSLQRKDKCSPFFPLPIFFFIYHTTKPAGQRQYFDNLKLALMLSERTC